MKKKKDTTNFSPGFCLYKIYIYIFFIFIFCWELPSSVHYPWPNLPYVTKNPSYGKPTFFLFISQEDTKIYNLNYEILLESFLNV